MEFPFTYPWDRDTTQLELQEVSRECGQWVQSDKEWLTFNENEY